MRPGTYKLDWQETQSRASTGLGAGSSYCQRSWPFLPLPFCQASGGSYYLQSSHILQPVALTSTSRSPPSPTGSSSSWKECLSTPTGTFMEEEGGFPQHCLSSPPPLVLCAPRHTSARAHTHTHTHTHMHMSSSPEVLEKGPGGGTLGVGWARQSWHHPVPCFNPPSHGRPAICCRSEAAIWRGDLCSLCWRQREGGA